MSDSMAVLLVDDRCEEIAPLLARLRSDIAVIQEARGDKALGRIEENTGVSAVLLDLIFEGQKKQGAEIYDEITSRFPRLPIIVLSASDNVGMALDLSHGRGGRRKAYAYFVKEAVEVEQLLKTVENAVDHFRLVQDKLRSTSAGPIVGTSPAIDKALRLVAKAAEVDTPVLITGEPGTGKELFARAIHAASDRRAKPFVPVSCGAVPADIFAPTLFGDASVKPDGAAKGVFRKADHGVVFLEDVEEIPVACQPDLLRLLQFGRLQSPIGDVEVDVRVIASTSRDLEGAVARGEFRQDLLYLLNVFPIRVPALRDRREDIAILVDHVLARVSPGNSLGKDGLHLLHSYDWPGNVRELEALVTRAALTAEEDVLGKDRLAALLAGGGMGTTGTVADWAERILLGRAAWVDLRREFHVKSSDTLKNVIDKVILQWKAEQGERPSGKDLGALLKIDRNHVNQILKLIGIRLSDYD